MTGVTADSTLWTADTHCVTADGRIICIDAELHEAALALDQLDAVTVAAAVVVETAGALDATDAAVGANVVSADVVEAAGALDQLNAAVVPLSAVGGGGGRYYPPPRPLPVEGVGYGVLPLLRGEAHGTVGAAGDGEVDEFPNDLELMLLMLAA